MFLGRGNIAARCLRHCKPIVTVMDASAHDEGWMLDAIRVCGITRIVSVQYQWILSGRMLEAVGYEAFNLHNAKLPNYKGHNSIHWALRNGDRIYTSTIHRMVERVDSGEIVVEAHTPIGGDTAETLYWKTVDACEHLFKRFMAGEWKPRPMPEGGKFYSKFDHGYLDRSHA